MFAKLLKHELRAQKGLFTVLSLAALGAGAFGGVMASLLYFLSQSESVTSTASIMLNSIFSLALTGAVIGLIAYAAGIFFVLIARFYKQHFADEGYLTFTLPATTHQHLLSSIVSIAIFTGISVVVTFLGLALIVLPLGYFATGSFSFIGEIWEGLLLMVQLMGAGNTLVYIFSFLASTVYSLVLPLLAITIGALIAKKHKILAAFGIYYGLNMAASVFTGMISITAVFSDILISAADGNVSFIFSSLLNAFLYLGISVGGYFLMHHLVDKKLNLQ